MAVNPEDVTAHPEGERPTGAQFLEKAASQLREHTDEGWLRSRMGVMETVRAVVRPGKEVHGRHELGVFSISAVVLCSLVSRELARLPGIRCVAIGFETTDMELDAVTVEVAVAYGEALAPLAARLRDETARFLRTILGEPSRAWTVNVRFTDVFQRE